MRLNSVRWFGTEYNVKLYVSLSTALKIHISWVVRFKTVLGTGCVDHATPLYPQKLTVTSTTISGRPVGVGRLRTKSHGVFCPVWTQIIVGPAGTHYHFHDQGKHTVGLCELLGDVNCRRCIGGEAAPIRGDMEKRCALYDLSRYPYREEVRPWDSSHNSSRCWGCLLPRLAHPPSDVTCWRNSTRSVRSTT
jgi:hypothetical protein